MQNKTADSKVVLLSMLPDDLIMEEILPRLPVKTLIRFKSVSKYWLSTISSQKFIQTHLKLFSSSCLQSLILYRTYIHDGTCILSFDESDNLKEMVELDYNLSSYSPDHPPRGGLKSYVIGSSNGLICLYELCFCYYIWNPATKQCHNVSSLDFDRQLYEVTGMGFGYVSSIDDYRIGLLIYDIVEDLCKIYVYSLRGRKWITMPSLDGSNENCDFRVGPRYYEGVVVDDTLYWPPRVLWHDKKDAHIAGLNLVNGEMKKFPLMNLINGYSSEVRVFRMRGCLSMCRYKYVNGDYDSRSCVTDVWKLKHQNDWKSWEKVMSFDFDGKNVLCLFENGKCLLRVDFNQPMLNNDDIRHVALKQFEEGVSIWSGGSNKQFFLENYIGEAWGYAESLISPFGTSLSHDK